MNTQSSMSNQENEFPTFDKKVKNSMISTIDRKRIFIFVAVTYGVTIALALVIFLDGGLFPNRTILVSILMAATMFTPAVGNIATRLITREGWKNTYLRLNLRRGWPYYLAAWILPLLAIIVGGGIYYLLFPDKFDLSLPFARGMGIPVPPGSNPWPFISREIIHYLTTAPTIPIILMLGEEFGWRAYLLPKLMPLGARKAVLLVGAIWGVFHWPLIFMGYNYRFDYWGAPVTGPLLFVCVILPQSVFLAWVTLRTGSVWPAALAHGVNNLSTMLMVYFHDGEINRLVGPGTDGFVGILGYALLALPIFLFPGALAQPEPTPINVSLSTTPVAVEKVVDQAGFGAAS
jgi:membrane protease YdiL (CAAX protease family)